MKKKEKKLKSPNLNLEDSFGKSNQYYLFLVESVLDFFQFAAQLSSLCQKFSHYSQSDFAYIGNFTSEETPENAEFKMSHAVIMQEKEIHITLLENKILLPPNVHLAKPTVASEKHLQSLSLFDDFEDDTYEEPYFLFGENKYSLFNSVHRNCNYVLLISVDKNHSIADLMDFFIDSKKFKSKDISDFLHEKPKQRTFLRKLFYDAELKTLEDKMLKISRLLRETKELPITGKFGDPKINMSSIEFMAKYRSLLETDSSFE